MAQRSFHYNIIEIENDLALKENDFMMKENAF